MPNVIERPDTTGLPWKITDETDAMYELSWWPDDGITVMIYKWQYPYLVQLARIAPAHLLTRDAIDALLKAEPRPYVEAIRPEDV